MGSKEDHHRSGVAEIVDRVAKAGAVTTALSVVMKSIFREVANKGEGTRKTREGHSRGTSSDQFQSKVPPTKRKCQSFRVCYLWHGKFK
ncbi:hypothetical protein HOLleu_40637 [Holothuria leucospilota]|uniref:Uncharacterized protein n=1 Tax=Holothuria leucospilota TaxID=206669 RepID=A0A9Q0YDM4_HOLLE|nr:hypothetical protein HOLleu_40637 [Holothuria leucospilota]